MNDSPDADDAEGMVAYFLEHPERVREQADELEADGRKELAGYIRYRLSLALGERPNPADAEAADLPMPEEFAPEEVEES